MLVNLSYVRWYTPALRIATRLRADWGTIFKLTSEGDETILCSFPNENTYGSLMLPSTGDLFGYYSNGDSHSDFVVFSS
jgi:hypothetical protein